MKGVFVTGTDTNIGKTQVAAGLAGAWQRRLRASCRNTPVSSGSDYQEAGPEVQGPVLGEGERQPSHSEASPAGSFTRRGDRQGSCGTVDDDASTSGASSRQVLLWKPVQSGVRAGEPEADSWRLAWGSGLPQPESSVATVTLPLPLAPWIAAERAGAAVDFAALVAEGRRRLATGAFCVVEGAGGLAVPLNGEKLVAHLAREMELPLLIVARPGLGTVNHTLLTVEYARMLGLQVAGVILNGYREEEREAVMENTRMIEQFSCGVPVVGLLPWMELDGPQGPDEARRDRWISIVESQLDWERLESRLG